MEWLKSNVWPMYCIIQKYHLSDRPFISLSHTYITRSQVHSHRNGNDCDETTGFTNRLLLRWDVPVPTGDASLYSAGESTGNRPCLWASSPEQLNTWGLSSESWCGHGVKVKRTTEMRSSHRCPSSAAQQVLSHAPSSSLVGLNRVCPRCYSSPCASVETCVSPFG